MNNISFQGKISVYEWKSLDKYVERTFNTSEAQDKLLKTVADSFAKAGTESHVHRRKLNFFHNLVEVITGHKIKNLNNDKKFYNGGDYISYKDENSALLNGVDVEVDFMP